MKYVYALLTLIGMSSANAVVYDFSGAIDRADFNTVGPGDPNEISGIALGSQFGGFFDYEPDSLILASPGSDVLINGVNYQVQLGGNTYFNPPNALSVGLIVDGSSARFNDIAPREDNSASNADDLNFRFTNVSGSPPSLDQFGSARLDFFLILSDPSTRKFIGSGEIEGEITSFVRRIAVPEPSTYALLMVGLFGALLGYRGRRRGSSDQR